MRFPIWSLVDVDPKRFGDATCSTAMSFKAREGLSDIFHNFFLDAISINSVFVRFKVSVLAGNQVYTLFRS